jgi:hypothetical protein
MKFYRPGFVAAKKYLEDNVCRLMKWKTANVSFQALIATLSFYFRKRRAYFLSSGKYYRRWVIATPF